MLRFVAGLSVAAIDRVDTDTVIFKGADVVDGTPVLDIKPYIPYVDGGVEATAPDWVQPFSVHITNPTGPCGDTQHQVCICEWRRQLCRSQMTRKTVCYTYLMYV